MNLRVKKRFGQHFLKDVSVVQQMLNFFAPQKSDQVVEIGPGMGALTKPLLEFECPLTVIEIDRDVISFLQKSYGFNSKLTIISQDALKVDYSSLVTNQNQKLRCIGNLPYNISTPLLFHLFEFRICIQDMLFMLQKEVVDRLVATPNSNDYGRLSVMAQYFCQIEHLFDVGLEAFAPPPRVNSAIVYLKPYENLPLVAKDFSLFQNVVRDAFNLRRKTIQNSLKPYLSHASWIELNIDPTRRPETLTIAEFVTISNAIFALSDMRK